MNPLSSFEVKELAYNWFKKITDHAALEEVLPLLYFDGLEMKFPEADLRSREDFNGWYSTVTQKYFDQIHDIKMLDVVLNENTATVKLIVDWQAHTWTPPQPYSKFERAYAHQCWTVVRDPVSGNPQIRDYILEKFDPITALPKS